MCKLLLQNDELRSVLRDHWHKELTTELEELCGMKNPSILRSSSPHDLASLTLPDIYDELHVRAPLFCKLMVTLCVSSGTSFSHHRDGTDIRMSKVVAPAAIILNARSPAMKAWALKNSISLQYSGCTNMALKRLSKQGVTVSPTTLTIAKQQLGEGFDNRVQALKDEIHKSYQKEEIVQAVKVAHAQSEEHASEDDSAALRGMQNTQPNKEQSNQTLYEAMTESATKLKSAVTTYVTGEKDHSLVDEMQSLTIESPLSVQDFDTSVLDADIKESEALYNTALQELLAQVQVSDSINEPHLDRLLELCCQKQQKKFQLIGDNIDMLIKTKQMSKEKQNTDIHWFLLYAIVDEIVDPSLSKEFPQCNIDDIEPTDCLPNASDKEKLNDIFTILWTRIIVKTIPAFKPFERCVIWHIPHKFQEEMKKKSETIPLGLLFHSENTEMLEIVSKLMSRYLPKEPIIDEDGHWTYRVLERVFFGGDWLTVERSLAAKAKRIDGDTLYEMLGGLTPKNEDWHAFRISFQRMLAILRNPQSESHKGTLWNLANVLQNSNFKLDPLDEYQRVKQSFYTMLKGYVTAATVAYFGFSSAEDFYLDIPYGVQSAEKSVRSEWLVKLLKPVIEKFCNIGAANVHDNMQALIQTDRPVLICRGCSKTFIYKKCLEKHEFKLHGLDPLDNREEAERSSKEDGDGIFNYGCTVLTLGLMMQNSDDAVREGDGGRIVDMYKWWLLIWKSQESTKYSLAALLLQVQVLCSLNEYDAHRLIWNRTVNRQGGQGRRVSLDFHMENIVKSMKQALKHLGVNITEKSAQMEARALQGIVNIVESHNKDLDMRKSKAHHRDVFSQKDIDTIVSVLLDNGIFDEINGRCFESFPKMKTPLLSNLDVTSLKIWMNKHFKQWAYEGRKYANAPN